MLYKIVCLYKDSNHSDGDCHVSSNGKKRQMHFNSALM